LGGGDLKLLFAAGPWIGFHMVPVLLFLSGIYGLLFYLLWKKLNMQPQQSADVPLGAFPYGPAICAAIFTCALVETPLLKILPL
jgi:Flp pilus assembly protein protease CpaA